MQEKFHKLDHMLHLMCELVEKGYGHRLGQIIRLFMRKMMTKVLMRNEEKANQERRGGFGKNLVSASVVARKSRPGNTKYPKRLTAMSFTLDRLCF